MLDDLLHQLGSTANFGSITMNAELSVKEYSIGLASGSVTAGVMQGSSSLTTT